MINRFKNKRILLFSPKFFDYGSEIARKLREYDAIVDLYDERPGNNFLTKGIIRVNKSLLSKKIDRYYRKIFSELEQEYYDFVLFLNPEAISNKNLDLLKKHQPRAIFIMYMWDSLKNKKYTVNLLPNFDWKYTFDKEDCLINAYELKFRPLFYLDIYRNIESMPNERTIDLLFVGTIHSDRYPLLMRIKNTCRELGKSVDFFMFFQSKYLYYFNRIFNKAFARTKISDFKFKPLNKGQLIEKISQSEVVLDIQHPSQKGLTMRTVEMIGARKKIITTNKEILDYDFYNPDNVYYLDRDNVALDPSFFETPYKELDTAIYHKYSIEGWLEDVFSPAMVKRDQ